MKLVLVTAVEAYQKEVLQIFKKADIENFSSSDIDGYKNVATVLQASSWFSGQKHGNESTMFFSFTEEQKIDNLFVLLEAFNKNLKTNNPLKAIVLPIERFI